MSENKIQLPSDAALILNKLNAAGHEAYIVGGCVRDSILGRIPQDWDITTSALPEETKILFDRTFDTGIQHGTITVVLHKENYEVTTYRVDGEYADCRHPDAVSFTQNLTEDLLRRDFTMNAIAFHPTEGFRDPFFGQKDIAAGIIRGVGEPAKRFQEDALRMLRCVRFAAQLGFSIDPLTWTALQENTPLIQKISAERIREELEKLWLSPYTEKMPLLWESGLLFQINPLLSERLSSNKSFLSEIQACPRDTLLRWCIVLQDHTPQEAKDFLKALKCDNHTIKNVSLLLEQLKQDAPTTPYPLRKLAGIIGADWLLSLLTLQAILRPHSPHAQSRSLLENILADGDCLTLKELAISGKDLMALGVPHGKLLGEILGALLDYVLQTPTQNEKTILTEKARLLLREKGLL